MMEHEVNVAQSYELRSRNMRASKIHPKSDNTKTVNFIDETFHRRECIRFSATDVRACGCNNNDEPTESSTPDSPSENAANSPIAESICKCGYRETMHRPSNEAVGHALPWSVEADTIRKPTDAYGRVEFDNTEDYKPFNKSIIQHFIRLDYEDNPGKVNELFRKYWEMKDPKTFMSIISGYQEETKKSQMHEFCEKLVEAATKTNSWIITDGAMEGIGGMIGSKIEKSFNKNGKTPNVVLSICNWGCIRDKHRLIKTNEQENHLVTQSICNECGGRYAAKEVSVDRNHTIYVLVDDGRQFHPGCEKIFRGRLEQNLREYPYVSTNGSVPFIYFLVGGDDNDIQTVARAVTNRIPVIVAKGTGGAADKIAEILEQEETDRPMATGEEMAIYYRIRQYRGKWLVLFDCNPEQGGSQDLSLYILTAMKGLANTNSPTNTFVLAADWDHEGFFKDLLLENQEESHLVDVLLTLIMKDKWNYVEILLSSRIKLAEVVTRIKTLEENGDMEEEIDKNLHVLKQITSSIQNSLLPEIVVRRNACKFLCIWSASRGQTEMANVFWREGENYLAMALIAYKVSRDKRKKWAGTEKAIAMKDKKKKFELLATGFLSTCDSDSRPNTIALLRGQVTDLGDQTPMQIAFDCDFKEFVAQPSFQELLDKIWTKGIIDYDRNFYFPLMVSIFCPFAASTLFKYHEDVNDRQNLDNQDYSPIKRVWIFLSSPVVKFIYNTLTYLVYLVLFSIVMLTDFRVYMSNSEITLAIWTFILIIEECKQAAIFRREYLNKWNLFDALALVLYVLGFILRLIYQSSPSVCLECLYVARIVLCSSFLLSVSRVLQLLSINVVLGPKIYMIGRLFKDLLSFMLIMTVFISAYGVVSNAILYPNQPLNAKLLQDVFYDAWWSFLQQFNTGDALGLNCNVDKPSPNVSVEYCSSRTDPDVDYVACKERKCPANTWLVSVLLAFYALFMVIMMVNVLIAMFNVTFSKVESKENRVSKMQRYHIIREYHFRSTIPAPLCVFVYLKDILCLFLRCTNCCWTGDTFLLCKSRCCTEDTLLRCTNCCCTGYTNRENICCTPLESSRNLFSECLDPSIKIWEERMLKKYEVETRSFRENTIATIVPVSEEDDRGSVYNLVLNNTIYINKQIEYSLLQIDSLLSKHFPVYTDESDVGSEEEDDETEDQHDIASTIDGPSSFIPRTLPSSSTAGSGHAEHVEPPTSSKRSGSIASISDVGVSGKNARDVGRTSAKEDSRIVAKRPRLPLLRKHNPKIGVYTTSVDNKKQVIFRHRFHGVNGGPVTVTISSPQVASVKQKDTSKPRRPKRQNISAQHKTQS